MSPAAAAVLKELTELCQKLDISLTGNGDALVAVDRQGYVIFSAREVAGYGAVDLFAGAHHGG